MKANKGLKRLTKIEALMSDVAKRFSTSAPHLQGVLKDLKAAIVRVKEAVTAQASSGAAKKKAAASKATRAGKKAAPARKKKTVKKAAVKAPASKTAKRRTPAKKAAQKTSPVAAHSPAEASAEEPIAAPA